MRFEENQGFRHVLEPVRSEVLEGFEWRGRWKEFFGNSNPIVLELGCGKGEYTVAMAKKQPGKNFIGIDVKGARLWYGAKEVEQADLANAAFIRTQIELIAHCFAPGEVSEIWITFPDPQIKYKRTKHRLTHPSLLKSYESIMGPEGRVHLKTDSEFLHGYSCAVVESLGYTIEKAFYDIDLQLKDPEHLLHTVRTHYEELFRKENKPITYLRFKFDGES